MAGYDAFVSYSHQADARLAPALHAALERLAKPFWRRRALHVFCDTSALSANPALWSTIATAMASSEYLVVLASPEGAQSPWMGREIENWRATKPADRILPVLTGGELVWDNSIGDFDRERSTALHPALTGAFSEEPLYVDLRFAREDQDLSLRNPLFLDAVAELAAPIRGVPKDEIVGEDLRQHRRTVRVTWSAALALVMLAVATLVGAVIALDKAAEVRHKANEVLTANRSAADAHTAEQASRNAKDVADRARVQADELRKKADSARVKALETANTARNEADRQSSVARKKQAEALASALDAQRQGALADAARQARDTAVGEKDQAVGARDAAVGEKNAAVDDKNKAVDAKNKADDQRRAAVLLKDAADHDKKVAVHDKNVAVRAERVAEDAKLVALTAASEANAVAQATNLSAAAQQRDLLDSSLDLALLLANAASRIAPEPVPGASAAAALSPSHPSAEARAALLATNQAASGLIGHLQFAGHAGPQNLDHIAVSTHGGAVAAAETSSAIQAGEQASRLYVWHQGLRAEDRPDELSKSLPAGDRLGCLSQVEWDVSGRFLFTVEDPHGCLNPDPVPGLPGFVHRTVRLWDVEALGTPDAMVAFPESLSLFPYSPLTWTTDHGVALIQRSSGVLLFDFATGSIHALPGFFLGSTLYGGENISPDGSHLVGAVLDLSGAGFVPALYPLNGQGFLVTLDDPNASLSLHFDPLGRVVATTVAGSGTLKFFDPDTGSEIVALRRTFPTEPSSIVLGRPVVNGSPVDRANVSLCTTPGCTGSATVESFDWTTPNSALAWAVPVNRPAVGLLTMSPGQHYVTVEWYAPHVLDNSDTPNTLVLDAATGATRRDVNGRVVLFSAPDERYVVGQERDAQQNAQEFRLTVRARVWDLDTTDAAAGTAGTLVRSETDAEVAPAPDGRSVALFPTSLPVRSGPDPTVEILSLDPGSIDAGPRPLAGAKGVVHSVAFDGDGHLFGIGEGGSGRVWDLAAQPYETLDLEASVAVLRTATSPDASLRAVTRDGTSVVFRHLLVPGQITETPAPSLPLAPGEQIDWMTFSRDGHLLLVNFHDPSQETVKDPHHPTGSAVVRLGAAGAPPRLEEEALGSSGDGTRLAFRVIDDAHPMDSTDVIIRSATDSHDIWRTGTIDLGEDAAPTAPNLYVLDIDGHRLAGTNGNGKAVIWSQNGTARVFTPGTDAPAKVALFGVAFSPDGTRLALTTPDKRLRIYDLTKATAEPVVTEVLSPSSGSRVRFSDDGEVLLVDGISLFDGHTLAQIGPRLHPDAWNDPGIDLGTQATFFTPDGQYVIAERGDGSQAVRWAVGPATLRTRACTIAGRNFTAHEVEQFHLPPGALRICPGLPPAGR